MQSRPLADRQDLEVAGKENRERIAHNPGLVSPAWTLYSLRADQVEFWQGDKEGKHTRLQFLRTGSDWDRQLLWP